MTWPRPSAGQLQRIYDAPGYYCERSMVAVPAEAARERAEQLLANLDRPASRVLDFGAGCGHLAAAFRCLGLVADGVEPSVTGRMIAKREFGLELHAELAEPSGEGYDLITLIHSLEHVEQPLATLRVLANHLTLTGTLLVEVPHAGSIELWRPSRRRWILDLPVHLYHFTPESMGRLVRAAGLEVERIRLFNCDAVEWLLRLRGRLARRTGGEHGGVEAKSGRQVPDGRLTLAHRGVRNLRRLAPGWKFQAFVRRP